MTVLLKQRTYRDAEGNACGEGVPARFLVGPEGARVTDETAVDLGLVNGHLPDSPEAKEWTGKQDKEYKAPRKDKTGRRQPAQGRPLNDPASKQQKLQDAVRAMVGEADTGGAGAFEKLFTRDGKPDSRVLSSRIEDSVNSIERDEAWEAVQKDNPELFADGDDNKAADAGDGSDPEGGSGDGPEGGPEDSNDDPPEAEVFD